MLNELYQLSCTLEKLGVLSEENTHRDIYKLGKFLCLYFRLDKDGNPVSMRLLNKDETGELWLHGKGNRNRFPAIRVQIPLLAEAVSAVFDEKKWNTADLAEKRQILYALDYEKKNPKSNEIQIKPWTKEQLKPVMESNDPNLEALQKLIVRFPDDNNESFCEALCEFLKSKSLTLDKSEADFVKKLLVGSFDNKKQKYTAECLCYFDIKELSQVNCPVAGLETEEALVRCLLEAEKNAADKENDEAQVVSALSGTLVMPITDKYPNPKFQVIGPAYLFSNNTKANPCLSHYGLEGVQAFAAGKKQVQKINDALLFLMGNSRKGYTWTSFPGKNEKTPMLLLAWLEDDPQNEAELAAAVGDDGATYKYLNLCKNVIDILSKRKHSNPSSLVHLQLFETLDKGRKQIVYSKSMSESQLSEDVNAWLEAAENLPVFVFKVRFKRKDGKEIRVVRPYCPGPAGISQLMQIHYKSRHGNNPGELIVKRSSSMTLQEIYTLFLPEAYEEAADKRFISEVLNRVLYVSQDLLTDAAYFQIVYGEEQPFSEEYMKRVCTAAALLGILLYKLEIRKEKYMMDTMFMLGRLLKLADKLHKEYCINERNNSLPGQLMGNAVIQMAMQTPAEAMVRLEEKIAMYINWAETDKKNRGGWILREIEKTVTAIMEDGGGILPKQPTSQEKTLLLFGYMASLPFNEKNTMKQDQETKKEEQDNE